jgi:hypothetical protein
MLDCLDAGCSSSASSAPGPPSFWLPTSLMFASSTLIPFGADDDLLRRLLPPLSARPTLLLNQWFSRLKDAYIGVICIVLFLDTLSQKKSVVFLG